MPLLEISELKKTYRAPGGARLPVIDVAGFQLDRREQAGLGGSSGCGKTTLLHLIAGIVTPDSGKVMVSGKDMAALAEPRRDRWRAAKIGYIFQTFNLLQGFTCLENVLIGMSFGKGSDRKAATDLLERMGLGNRLDYYPRQLSTGQQQRVAVARALANQPELVLADEPAGNLDPDRAREAIQLIRDTCEEAEAALLLVSHDAGVLEGFQRRFDLKEINRASEKTGEGA